MTLVTALGPGLQVPCHLHGSIPFVGQAFGPLLMGGPEDAPVVVKRPVHVVICRVVEQISGSRPPEILAPGEVAMTELPVFRYT